MRINNFLLDVLQAKWMQSSYVIAKTKYIKSNSTFVEVALEPADYVLIPCLQEAGEIGSFAIKIMSDKKFVIKGDGIKIQ